MIDLGDPWPNLSVTTRNAADVPENATAVVLTVTLPDGTTATPAVTAAGAGIYTASYTPTLPGRHTARWVATGVNASAYTDAIDVDEAAPDGIVSLADAKAHMNITSTTHDEELRTIIDAVTPWVEDRVGPVVRRTIGPVVVRPAGGMLFLEPPVISLTTVTAAHGYTATYTVGDMYLDGDAGLVEYGATGSTFAYPVTVTYVAGRAIVPAAIQTAAKMMVKALWETQRGATPLPTPGFEDNVELGSNLGMAVWRAEKLLDPYRLAPAVA